MQKASRINCCSYWPCLQLYTLWLFYAAIGRPMRVNMLVQVVYWLIHKPESFSSNAINHYTAIHFFQYAVVSFIRVIKLWHIAIFSVIWEIFELYTHFEWGRESWLNKLIDIVFNILGFQFGRRIFSKK